MDKAIRSAGFFVSHAVWIISKKVGILGPFAGFESPDNHRTLVEFDDKEFALRVETARKWLDENPDGAVHAVLIFDGFVLLPSGKTDALIIEVRKYGSAPESLSMLVPYRPLSAPEGFGVYRPRYLEYSGWQEESLSEDSAVLDEAFWRGVASHDDGATAWKKIDDAS
jgi:hypothetical protein